MDVDHGIRAKKVLEGFLNQLLLCFFCEFRHRDQLKRHMMQIFLDDLELAHARHVAQKHSKCHIVNLGTAFCSQKIVGTALNLLNQGKVSSASAKVIGKGGDVAIQIPYEWKFVGMKVRYRNLARCPIG